MHIALVSAEYPPQTFQGGVGSYTKALARNLAMLGHRVTVVSDAASRPCIYEEDGVQVHRVVAAGSAVVGGHRLMQPLRRSLAVYVRLQRIHRQNPIDVVEFPDFLGEGAVTTLAGTFPTLVRCHSTVGLFLHLENKTPQGRQGRLLCALERFALRRADLIVATSESIRNAYSSLYDLPLTALEVQHNGLSAPDSFLERTQAKEPHKRPGNDVVVFLHTGRQEWRKGNDILLRAFARANVPHKKLIMVGADTLTAQDGGSMRQYCYALAQQLNVAEHVQILDRVPQDELLTYYRSSDVFVAPSRYDSCSLAYVEAMATGLPVIGTTAGGAPEVITPECGRVVPPENVADLAAAMEELGTNPGLRQAMGEAGWDRVCREYTQARHAERMVHWYQKAIVQHRARKGRVVVAPSGT